MNQTTIRLLFDENFGKPLVSALSEFVSHNKHGTVEVRHILDEFNCGANDEVWIPRIAEENFILISADRHKQRGSKGTRGKPLPRLCVEYGIRHVLLTGGWSGHKMFDRILAVLSVWHEILGISSMESGVRFNLEPIGIGKGKLIKKTPNPIPPTKTQGNLFILPRKDENKPA